MFTEYLRDPIGGGQGRHELSRQIIVIFVIFVIFVKKTPLLRLLLRWYVCIILLFLKSRSSPIEKWEDTYGYVRVRVSDEGGVWETFNSLRRNTKMPRVLSLFGYQLW
jgi:hypothetical protein